jgi:hypothetical protein
VKSRVALIALVVAAAGAAAALAAAGVIRHRGAPSAARCGGPLWRLKTLSDPGRGRVDLTPTPTTIAAIRERQGPGRPPLRRTTSFQTHVWEVPAQITSYKLEATGALRLVLYDDNAYINAVVPSASCLSARTRDRGEILDAWNDFTTKCGKATPTWQSLGAILFVRGVGFWSQRRQERGSAPNGAELYPVTGFRVIAGCRQTSISRRG